MQQTLRMLVTTILIAGCALAVEARAQSDAGAPEKLKADCVAAGFTPGQAPYEDCLATLKQAVITMRHTMMANMSTKACSAAGLQPGTAQFDACVSKLQTSLAGERNSG